MAQLLPSSIIQGDTFKRTVCVPNYPADEGWTLTFTLAAAGQADKLTITTTADGANHQISEAAAVTAAWEAATYGWSARVTRDDEAYTIGSGTFEVVQDIVNAPVDKNHKSYWVQAREAIQAVLLGRATEPQKRFMIGDKSVDLMSFAELRGHLEYTERRIAKENGRGTGGIKKRIRFVK